ncbi:---NA--- [Podarcis lilfordi]|uniref:---NA n=1 Tax=Podarcis lilfordi TaxID=74358 RepID=A0AA35LHU2_9SAUR|nr:---NA--- [Podarcis lilfordi]
MEMGKMSLDHLLLLLLVTLPIEVLPQHIRRHCARHYFKAVEYICETYNYASSLLDDLRYSGPPRVELAEDHHRPNAEPSPGHFFDSNNPRNNSMDAAEEKARQKIKYIIGIAGRVRSGFPQVKRFKRQEMYLPRKCCTVGCSVEEIIDAHC